MKRRVTKRRFSRGMSLLELVIATSMLAMMLTAIGVVMRTARQAWEAHAADYTRIEAAHATIRHIVRRVRHAHSVTLVSATADNSGHLELKMPDNSIEVWDHDSTLNSIQYGTTSATSLLAPNIAGLRFTCYQADGTTETTATSQIRAMRIEVTIQLPVQSGGNRVISSWAWIRTW